MKIKILISLLIFSGTFAFGQLDITKRNITVTENFHVRGDTVPNMTEVNAAIKAGNDTTYKGDFVIISDADTIWVEKPLETWYCSIKQFTGGESEYIGAEFINLPGDESGNNYLDINLDRTDGGYFDFYWVNNDVNQYNAFEMSPIRFAWEGTGANIVLNDVGVDSKLSIRLTGYGDGDLYLTKEGLSVSNNLIVGDTIVTDIISFPNLSKNMSIQGTSNEGGYIMIGTESVGIKVKENYPTIVSGDLLAQGEITIYDTATFKKDIYLIDNASFILNASQDTTVTAEIGKIVFKASDSHFYGCRQLTGKKWYQLDND